jgi:hypothetical protein
MKQFKSAVFHSLLEDHIEKQLSRERTFKIAEINWDFPIAVDIDQTNS